MSASPKTVVKLNDFNTTEQHRHERMTAGCVNTFNLRAISRYWNYGHPPYLHLPWSYQGNSCYVFVFGNGYVPDTLLKEEEKLAVKSRNMLCGRTYGLYSL